MTDEQKKVMRPCPGCQGRGLVNDPHCQDCGQRLAPTNAWWETNDEILPCGHPAAALIETVTCPECGGNGRYPQSISHAQWQQWRRRKMLIGAALLIALLLPVAAVAAAVADAYPGYVCGSWWYGMIVAGLFVSQKNKWLK
jgi:hypothetical protein